MREINTFPMQIGHTRFPHKNEWYIMVTTPLQVLIDCWYSSLFSQKTAPPSCTITCLNLHPSLSLSFTQHLYKTLSFLFLGNMVSYNRFPSLNNWCYSKTPYLVFPVLGFLSPFTPSPVLPGQHLTVVGHYSSSLAVFGFGQFPEPFLFRNGLLHYLLIG